MNTHGSVAHNSPKLQAIHMPINRESKYSTAIQWSEKEQNADMCPNIYALQKHYAKWKKPDLKDYILCDPIYMKCPENTDLEM